jgi:hypothetical protein
MAVNLSGPFYMAHAAVPGMRARKFGRIINVTTSYFTCSIPLRPTARPIGLKPGAPAWPGVKGTALRLCRGARRATDTPMVPDDGSMERSQLIRPEKMAHPSASRVDAGDVVTGVRFVAAKWDSFLSVADAIAASGAPAGWP